MSDADSIIIGAGTVGASIAYGLAKLGQKVLVLDAHDGDFRAARANFGLVWVQGKGVNMPAYREITRASADAWQQFVSDLRDATDVPVEYRRDGGLTFCLGEAEFEARRHKLGLDTPEGSANPYLRMIERGELERLMPRVDFGDEVIGASFSDLDGDTNPLQLLTALHIALRGLGGTIRGDTKVLQITSDGNGFQIRSSDRVYTSERLVIAAGLGSAALASQVGLDIPLRPLRGQILVTARVAPFLPLPASGLRQTADGTVMIGATQEDVGMDAGTTMAAAAKLSCRALRVLPALSGVSLVRQWAGLRVMSPDTYPILAQSKSHPGAFVATCHSGVTLAPYFAEQLPRHILGDFSAPALLPFHHERFDVCQVA